MPDEQIPKLFQTTTYPHGSLPDRSGDTRRFLKDMLVDERRDDATLRYVGNRQSKVVGRLSQL